MNRPPGSATEPTSCPMRRSWEANNPPTPFLLTRIKWRNVITWTALSWLGHHQRPADESWKVAGPHLCRWTDNTGQQERVDLSRFLVRFIMLWCVFVTVSQLNPDNRRRRCVVVHGMKTFNRPAQGERKWGHSQFRWRRHVNQQIALAALCTAGQVLFTGRPNDRRKKGND